MPAIPSLTDSSESTSIAYTAIGSFSFAAISARAGAFDGFRIVACTLYPARANANAIVHTSNPQPHPPQPHAYYQKLRSLHSNSTGATLIPTKFQ